MPTSNNLRTVYILEGFNNYYNRRILSHAAYSDYLSAASSYTVFTGINFNPNDGVTTDLIVNAAKNPDYLLVLDDNYAIESRWFILRTVRTRGGQYQLSLRRDVIVDNLGSLMTSPLFVEKGMLPESDPFILNDEGMSVNQIKTSETLLRDKTKSAWIVGYYAKNVSGSSDVAIQVPSETITDYFTPSQIATAMGISEVALTALFNTSGENVPSFFNNQFEYRMEMDSLEAWSYNYKIKINAVFSSYENNTQLVIGGNGKPLVSGVSTGNATCMEKIAQALIANKTYVKTELATAFSRTFLTSDQLATLYQYNGQKVYYNGNYYYLEIDDKGPVEDSTGWQTASGYANIYSSISDGVGAMGSSWSMKSDGYIDLIATSNKVYIKLRYIGDSTVIPQLNASLKSSRTPVDDQEFDMFIMPYNDMVVYGRDSSLNVIHFNAVGDYARKVASAIALKEGEKLYDLQLLPYCPMEPYWNENANYLYLANLTLDQDYSYISYTSNGQTINVGVIIWCKSNKFQTKLQYSIIPSESLKTDSNINMHRLVSPNYQGTFEFNVAKNGGQIAYYQAECTYKPYTPFIKVAPAFRSGWLYGTNYGDHRGLLCGGDFSLPRITSAWQQFQLNNKNYQNIFNRDIQNLDFRQSQEMRRAVLGGSLGVASDTLKGGMAGAQSGIGAGVGAAIGGVGSAIGLGIDIDMLAKRQREEKQLAIDKYNYQLGNVKALPYTLTKIGAFDICSKIYPFVEYFTCTNEERTAFINKIKFESMTVMRIGYIGDFVDIDDLIHSDFKTADGLHYLKGTLIRNESIITDNNVLSAIADEFQKGVFI